MSGMLHFFPLDLNENPKKENNVICKKQKKILVYYYLQLCSLQRRVSPLTFVDILGRMELLSASERVDLKFSMASFPFLNLSYEGGELILHTMYSRKSNVVADFFFF